MSQKDEPTQGRIHWSVGQRVARKDSNELGTVVQTDGKIKVKWDDGRTSYFIHGKRANVRIPGPPQR
jgi:hypothetical protein